MKIQPTTEHMSGHTPMIRISEGVLDWICTANFGKESDIKTSDDI